MKPRFTPQAVHDIAELADYIRAENPAAAQSVRDAIYETLRNVLVFPKVGRRQTTENVRKVITRNEARKEVIVLSVKHPARERDHSDT